jgi:hypothetical protein
MGRDVATQIKEIENTEVVLKKLAEQDSGISPLQLDFHRTEQMNWFCGMFFMPHTLVISTYQHEAFDDVGRIKTPTFVVDTRVYPQLETWFKNEWKELAGSWPS